MTIRFDASKARFDLSKHGASFAHAEQALHDSVALTIKDPDAQGEQRFVPLAWTRWVALLVVIHAQREERTRLISARKASRGERDRHHA